MNDHRNMILAIVLSAIVLIGWGFLSERFLPTANPPEADPLRPVHMRASAYGAAGLSPNPLPTGEGAFNPG